MRRLYFSGILLFLVQRIWSRVPMKIISVLDDMPMTENGSFEKGDEKEASFQAEIVSDNKGSTRWKIFNSANQVLYIDKDSLMWTRGKDEKGTMWSYILVESGGGVISDNNGNCFFRENYTIEVRKCPRKIEEAEENYVFSVDMKRDPKSVKKCLRVLKEQKARKEKENSKRSLKKAKDEEDLEKETPEDLGDEESDSVDDRPMKEKKASVKKYPEEDKENKSPKDIDKSGEGYQKREPSTQKGPSEKKKVKKKEGPEPPAPKKKPRPESEPKPGNGKAAKKEKPEPAPGYYKPQAEPAPPKYYADKNGDAKERDAAQKEENVAEEFLAVLREYLKRFQDRSSHPQAEVNPREGTQVQPRAAGG